MGGLQHLESSSVGVVWGRWRQEMGVVCRVHKFLMSVSRPAALLAWGDRMTPLINLSRKLALRATHAQRGHPIACCAVCTRRTSWQPSTTAWS